MPLSRLQVYCRRLVPWARDWRLGVLVGLLLLLVVGDLPVVHGHDESGLYNEECPLARLGTCTPRTLVPAAMPAPEPLPVCDTLWPTVWAEAPPASIAPSAPRAPPAVV
jgi:hypothetical protein